MRRLYLSTTSQSKARQFSKFLFPLGYEVEALLLDLPEIQSADVAVVARKKGEAALEKTPLRPLLVDDTGVIIEGLKGFPGALMKPILELGGISLLRQLCEPQLNGGRVRAEIVSAIVLFDGDRRLEATSRLGGTLDFNDKSHWDDEDCTGIFYLDGETLPQNQLPEACLLRAYAHRLEALSSVMKGL